MWDKWMQCVKALAKEFMHTLVHNSGPLCCVPLVSSQIFALPDDPSQCDL